MIEKALNQKPFGVIAHRGGGLEVPENTIKGIKHAIRIKADIVEVDIRSTKDGELILLHDSDFERVAGVAKEAKELEFAYIKENILIEDSEPVATLAEALESAKGKIAMFLEIKEPDTCQKVVELVQEYQMQQDVCIISFYEEVVSEVKRLDSTITTGLVYSYPPGKIPDAKQLGCALVLPHYRIATAKANRFAHNIHLKVGVWTVNEEDLAIAMHERGADLIASDYPKMLLKLRKRLQEGGVIEKEKIEFLIEEVDDILLRKVVLGKGHFLIERDPRKDNTYHTLKEKYNNNFYIFDEYKEEKLTNEVVLVQKVKRSKVDEIIKKFG
ncbi:glycerophosphodiester phosphodiesterase [Nitratiruptor tergarcus]|uniref:Glycerophosphoryl diester phosphodiesterase n=1 Tax=Nitratiruptor tergarcus DSM 16512 TaxID=1069081 RepID=A0A1W1WSI1_9BACT|nr:glycerophosphodiester phosphodiesterase [Nitratiruptor tergarcus]SMC09159.1 glycerophosphoryl diester phosphodiesterase [Nitratiruptor tergarcus DSM 16512]